ncbi:MAG: pepE [Chitinophagaceae bacterium]|jgi:dipeptidase E|nr:pepE [Chitinophagaceae bacterium]
MNLETRILALSSSRVGKGGYLQQAIAEISRFLGEKHLNIAFIPFAFVDENKDPLVAMVKEAFAGLPHAITTATTTDRPVVEQADVIMVSGGNTFKLLHDLYKSGLLEVIREKVLAGTPYIGWSAGSNITGATICTTNDMPIIEPESFRALAFFPFQINPHYYNVVMEGFNGETRDQRLTEFLKLNPGTPVVCLPEGTALLQENGKLTLVGSVPGILMKHSAGDIRKTELPAGIDLSHLCRGND